MIARRTSWGRLWRLLANFDTGSLSLMVRVLDEDGDEDEDERSEWQPGLRSRVGLFELSADMQDEPDDDIFRYW
jgi:hypothetical protein